MQYLNSETVCRDTFTKKIHWFPLLTAIMVGITISKSGTTEYNGHARKQTF